MSGVIFYREPAKVPPCRAACPAGIDVPRYVRLISEGEFDQALAVVRERIPFPSICGRVCPSPCELYCRLNDLGSPVAIRALKRFVADRVPSPALGQQAEKRSGKHVAIIGSGPAGLTAAYYLARQCHEVTVFEALPESGGMMRWGIPEFRLPRKVLAQEIGQIQSAGVDIRTSTPVKSITGLRRQGYDAVFVGIGAWASEGLGIPGEKGSDVMPALEFLTKTNSGAVPVLGETTVVIGGGHPAVDAARVARRAGAEDVWLVYQCSHEEIPAGWPSLSEAEREGVRVQLLAAPVEMVRENGRLSAVSFIRMKLGAPDASGRRQPLPVDGSRFDLKADSAIVAAGERPDASSLGAGEGVRLGAKGTVEVDPQTLETAVPGVFAGGDAVSGPASVIKAIAMGRRAAASIDRFLGGGGEIGDKLTAPEDTVKPTSLQGFPIGDRNAIPSLNVEQRASGFAEVELGIGEDTAVAEAKRCLRCDLPIRVDTARCLGCLTCALYCSLRMSDSFNPLKAAIKVWRYGPGNHEYEMGISFTRECVRCGLCARYCPYGAITREIDVAYLESKKQPRSPREQQPRR